MANEGAVVVAVVINPGVRPQSHVHLVSCLKPQSHAVGCCLVAVSSYVVVHCNHLHSILHEPQPHWSS